MMKRAFLFVFCLGLCVGLGGTLIPDFFVFNADNDQVLEWDFSSALPIQIGKGDVYVRVLPLANERVVYAEIVNGDYDDRLSEMRALLDQGTGAVFVAFSPLLNEDNEWALLIREQGRGVYDEAWDYIQGYFDGVDDVQWVYETALFPDWYRLDSEPLFYVPDSMDIMAFSLANTPFGLISNNVDLEYILRSYTQFFEGDTAGCSVFLTGLSRGYLLDGFRQSLGAALSQVSGIVLTQPSSFDLSSVRLCIRRLDVALRMRFQAFLGRLDRWYT